MTSQALRHPLYSQGQRAADVAFPNSVVNASGKGIQTLDGAKLVPSVEVLDVSNNRLVNFFGLVSLPRMRCLYADQNSIDSFAGMSFQPGLEILSMDGNPVIHHPMFRVMALLCAGETLRIVNHKAVSEAERSLCQSFGGPSGDAAKLVSLGWTGLGKKPEPLSTYASMVAEAQSQFENMRNSFNVFASDRMLRHSLQSFVEQMRVEEGIAGFATGASPSTELPKERSQHGAYGMAIGKSGPVIIGDNDLPASDAALDLRGHLYNDASPPKTSPIKRPPWDFTPAPVPPGPVFLHERLVMDSESYNANDYSTLHSDRGGPARHVPKGRDIYNDTVLGEGHAASAAQYQEEVDRAVAIDTARTFLNRVKKGGTTESLSEPVDLRNPGPSAAEREQVAHEGILRQQTIDEAEQIRKWVAYHSSRHRDRLRAADEGNMSDVAHFSAYNKADIVINAASQPKKVPSQALELEAGSRSRKERELFNGTSARQGNLGDQLRVRSLNYRISTNAFDRSPVETNGLLLSTEESGSLASITFGPAHVYTSVMKNGGPIETHRNSMLAVDFTRRILSIAIGTSDSDANARVVAQIPLCDILDVEIQAAPLAMTSLATGGSRPTSVRLSLVNDARMDLIPCDPSRRNAMARGMFKVLSFAVSADKIE